jgi:hypothetical protein
MGPRFLQRRLALIDVDRGRRLRVEEPQGAFNEESNDFPNFGEIVFGMTVD